jgi:hypothetical protein
MMTTAVSLFAASFGAFIGTIFAYDRAKSKVQDYLTAVDDYLKKRLDSVIADASNVLSLRERLRRMLDERDIKDVLLEVNPTGYRRALYCFGSSGGIALIVLALDAASVPWASWVQGLIMTTLIAGAIFVVNDIWYYHRLDKILNTLKQPQPQK